MNIYLDIETIPGQDERCVAVIDKRIGEELAKVRAPSNYKDEAKIAAYIENKGRELAEKREELWKRTALDGSWGELLCWCVATDDDIPTINGRTLADDESSLIVDLFDKLDAWTGSNSSRYSPPRFIGWNIEFDLKFIWQRAILNNVLVPSFFPVPLNIKPQGDRTLDLQQYWGGWRQGGKLKDVCAAFNMEDNDISGADVWDHVQQGKYTDVYSHCLDDVKRVKELATKMGVAA